MEALVLLSIIPGRQSGSEKAELTTQFLFGERFTILERKKEWSLVKNHHDGYIAWVNNLQITCLSDEEAIDWDSFPILFNHQFYRPILTQDGHVNLSIGARIPQVNQLEIAKHRFLFGNGTYKAPEWEFFIKTWVNTPYLWGGKSVFGIDCSGYTQLCLSFKKENLPRDAWMQAKIGTAVNTLGETALGDLAFFEKDNKITHVGIMLSDGKIAHASGKVRVDKLTDEGIYNASAKQITHKLSNIQRIIS